ncbi:MAG: fibronectin type III domain-containing protein, partial [Flavobacteriaceae bacterium]|nr:fibronectin type III domain-containing protein [Flavobacteriaceae bacterium]
MIRKLLLLTLFLCFFTSISYAQGNNCGVAETLTINGACDGPTSIANGTQDLPLIATCPGTFGREGWYTFDVTGGPLDVTITGITGNRNQFLQLISSTGTCTGLTQIACANADTNANSAQTESITQTLANGTYYVKVVNVGNGNMDLTSLCITAPIPCNPPTLNATTAITQTSATINWNVASPVPAVGYEYVVSTVNTTPGGAGTATTNLSEPITGLTASTTYYVFVRSNCGAGNFSSWSPSGTFTTAGTVANDLCANATALPCGTTNLAGTTN